jgi:hypothetical protein
MLLVMAAMNLVRPLVMGDVIRQADRGDGHKLLRDGLVLSGLLVVVQTMSFLQQYMMQLAGARAMADLRAHVFLFLQRLQLRYFDRTPVGRLVTRATNDVDALGEMFASGALNAMGDLVALTGIVVMMVILDWRLSLIAFAALPLVLLIVGYVRTRSRIAYRDIRGRMARLNAFLNEQVSGIAVVQAFAREKRRPLEEFDEINDSYRDANKRSIFYEALLDAAIEMVSTLCIASILFYGGLDRIGSHRITFPIVVTFTQYVKQFFEPVSCSRSGTRCSRARWPAPSESSGCSIRTRRTRPSRGREVRPRRACGRGDRARARELRVQARGPGAQRRDAACPARREGGARGGDRGGQDDGLEPRPSPLRGEGGESCASSGRTSAATIGTRSARTSRSCRRTSSSSQGRCCRTSR